MTTASCPTCQREIPANAVVCSHCREVLKAPESSSNSAKTDEAPTWLASSANRPSSLVKTVCAKCGAIDMTARSEARGNSLVEIGLWCLLVVPGVVYSIWRRRPNKVRCDHCSSAELVAVDSPEGREIRARFRR